MFEFQEIIDTSPLGIKRLNDQLRQLWNKSRNMDTKDIRNGAVTGDKISDDVMAMINQVPLVDAEVNAIVLELNNKLNSIDWESDYTALNSIIDTKLNSIDWEADYIVLSGAIGTKVSQDGYDSYVIQTANTIASKVSSSIYNSYVIQTADTIASKVASTTYNSYVLQTATLIGSKVTSTDYESYKTQTATAISAKVSTVDLTGNAIVSFINQTATTITLQANKIGLLGAVNIPNLTANKIVGGTLTLGGLNNNNGTMVLNDNSNVLMGTFDNNGVYLYGGSYATLDKRDNVNYTSYLWGGAFLLGCYNSITSVGYTSTTIESTPDFNYFRLYGNTRFLVNNGNIDFQSDLTVSGGLYVGGNVSGLSFTDRTPFYKGDAITELMQIKSDQKGDTDHNTLPLFARKQLNVEKQIGVKKVKRFTRDGYELEDVPIMEPAIEEGRDLGAMISILTVGVQQIVARLEQLEFDTMILKNREVI